MGVGASSSRTSKLKKKADDFFQKGRYDRALSYYQRVLEADPGDTFIHQRIADCYERLDQKGDAVQALLKLAEVYQNDGRNTHALATLRRAQRIDPGNVDVLEKMAELLNAQKNTLEARSILQQLVDVYTRQNRLTKVLETLEKLLAINPNDLNLHYRLAQIKAEIGRTDEAAQTYADLTLKLLENGELTEAHQVCQKGLEYFPDHPVLKDALFDIYLETEQYQQLIRLFDTIKNPEIHHFLKVARAYAGLNRYNDSLNILMEALRRDPENPDVYRAMVTYIPDERWDEIRSLLVGFLEKSMAQGRTSVIWETLGQALERKPDDSELLNLAVTYLGQYQQETKSLEILDRAISRSLENGNFQQSLALIDKILAVDPDNEQYREKRAYILEQMSSSEEEVKPVTEPAPPPSIAQPTVEEVSEYIDQEEVKEYIQGQITEAEVFYRYGMVQKAAEELERLIRQYPLVDEIEQAYRKLYRIYLNEGLHDRAVDKLFQLANFLQHHGKTDKIPEIIDEIRTVRPNDERLAQWEEIATAAAVDIDEYLDISSEIDGLKEEIAASDDVQAILNQELEEVNFYLQQGLLDDARRLIQKWQEKLPEHPEVQKLTERMKALEAESKPAEVTPEELEFEIELELDEPPALELEEETEEADALQTTAVLETQAPLSTTAGENEGEEQAVTPDALMETQTVVAEPEQESVVEPPPVKEKSPPPPAPKKERSTVDDLIESILESTSKKSGKKAKKMQEKGAEEVLQKVLSDLTASVRTSKERKETAPEPVNETVPEAAVVAPPVEPEPVEETVVELSDSDAFDEISAEGMGITGAGSDTDELSLEFMDLAGELEQEILQVEEAIETTPDDQLSVALTQLKQKIEEVVPEDDARTHFDLGQAYMLMDLVDEAIVEFQKAERHPHFMVDSNYQLADCFVRKGLPEAAVRCYRKILEAESIPTEQREDVLYRLGTLLEQMGESEQAYEIFLELLSSNASYRDVKDRVNQLESLRKQKPH